MIKTKVLRRDTKAAAFFLLPSIAGFAIFFIIPFIAGIYYSLIDSPIGGKFVGLKNYISLLSNPIFLKAAGNTLLFTAISVPVNMLLSLGLAILLNKSVYLKKILRTAFITPVVIPVASVVLVWQVLFDMRGSINGLITSFGFGAIDWMKTDWARIVLVIVYIWKNVGYNMVLFLAGLQNIPEQYYESADIDGAGVIRKFASITLIYLTPTAFFVFIISIINSFKVFRETYLISGPYPHDSIYMLQHYMNNMFASLDYQKLTSAACIMAAVICILVVGLFAFERKIGNTIS